MRRATLETALERMASLSPDWDGCGSAPPSPACIALASRLVAGLTTHKLIGFLRAVTVCPNGCPLFDLASGTVRVSIACVGENQWKASVTSHAATLAPIDGGNLNALLAIVALMLR